MAPLELLCRGGDPRAMKGFISAALSGVDVTFSPITTATSGGAQIRLGDLSDANAIARFLGSSGGGEQTFVPTHGAARWAVERWTEWESCVLSQSVSVACATKDASDLTALLSGSFEARLSEVGFNGADFVSLAGKSIHEPTLADVAIYASLYPALGESKAAGLVNCVADDSLTMRWFNSLESESSSRAFSSKIAAGAFNAKASAVTAAGVVSVDGNVLKLQQMVDAVPVDPSNEKFSITTAINYANGAPHMGHAYEAVSSDVIARYHRAYGRDVLFQTGSDEHGQKISEAAEVAGCKPIDLCDKHVVLFKGLNEKIAISNDVYNRTTSDVHKTACKELFNRSKKNGDIYLDTYEGWYNVREETFVTESDAQLSEYIDPVSGKPLKKMSEESYFFRQSRYQEQLVAHIEQNPEFIQPTRRRNEILVRLREDKLRDLSVSRTTFDWGIPVPDAPGHVLYVWFDALTNYLTGTGWPDVPTDSSSDSSNAHQKSSYWPADVHIIGKDISWFHCVIWPCMLWSAGLPLPKCVFGHGFVMAGDGQKMSKSIGNVVDPLEQLKKYSSDTFRYYLMRNGVYGSDIPFSESNLILTHNSDLADVLGNLIHRATNLCAKNCSGVVPDVDSSAIEKVIDVPLLRAHSELAMKSFATHTVCELAINAVKDTNKYLTESAPWAVKGDGAEVRKAVIIRSVLEAAYVAAHFLSPFIPDSSKSIFEKLNTQPVLIWRLKSSNNLTPGTKIAVGEILFAKHEADDLVIEAKDKKEKKAQVPVAKKAAVNAPVDVSRLSLKVGTITKVWRHPDAEKLYVELIEVGDASGPRQVVSGLAEHVPENEMLGKRVVVVANMKPSKMRGVESTAMVLCGTGNDGKVECVSPPEGVANGTVVTCADFPSDPDEQLNPKKKVFEAVSPDFSIKDGVATYKGSPFKVGDAVCTLPTLKEGTIK